MSTPGKAEESSHGIAVVGMACRFPGSANLDEFWELLRAGAEAVTSLSEADLRAAGVDPWLFYDPNYVKRRGVLPGIDLFDAGFFGFSPREAELTDPQQRLFLECAWTALEDASHDPDSYGGSIGLYAGSGWNSYLLFNLASHRGLFESDAGHQALLGNDKDNLTTRVSYKLNLQGPSVGVQTGCSTSLVAVSLACHSLRSYQCDLALAGGVSILLPQGGYVYRPGGIFSPDGRCRAFDARAQGTVLGSGVGVVVLKRVEDAIAERDHIRAVIKAAAINNDGALKAGYTAPSVEGQAKVIVEAQAIAEVSPRSITYVEAHGTGTALGDPIEVAALTKAFRDGTPARGFCALGSVKTNLGHLDAAAGVAGLIKTVLALEHREIPPSLHFETPNPEIDFAGSPFRVNTARTEWDTGGAPRRAGVSSFGLGGTNAHVILEEAPVAEPSPREALPQLLVLSARSKETLETATTQLAHRLRQHPELELADVAYTLQVGRKAFAHRRFLVSHTTAEAAAALEARDPQRVRSQVPRAGDPAIAFMFTGQGAQHVNMARGLYQAEPTFRRELDRCFDVLGSRHALDLRRMLYPAEGSLDDAAARLAETEHAQPALFVVEYALARLWMSWGIAMRAAIGHSIGEYVAATLAGVFALEDALSLVTARGRLIQGLPRGGMLAVSLPLHDVTALLGSDLSVAAINEPSSCVVSGTSDAITALQHELASRAIGCHRLDTSHAFHSRMMDPMLQRFSAQVERVRLRPPAIPFVSNVTGRWITDTEATDARYWVRHIRQPVCFAEGLRTLLVSNAQVLLEVGPGRTLSQFARRHPERREDQLVLSTLRCDDASDVASLLECVGQLWLAGARVEWSARAREQRRRRVRLPTYPFERQRYWVEPAPRAAPEPLADDAWRAIVDAVRERAHAALDGFDQPAYLRAKDHIDALCLAQMNLALRRLGAFSRPADRCSVDALLQQCKVVPRYHQLVTRMLSTLSEHGQLRRDGELLTDLAPCSPEMVQAFAREAERAGADRALLGLVQTCGRVLPAVLTGEQEPLELFSPVLEGDSGQSGPQGFLDSQYSSLLCCALEQLLRQFPTGATLRVLEIGGGTGIATACLLPVLPPDRTAYTFTDVGKFFLSRAQEKFAAYPFVRYALLDIDRPPLEQGFSGQSYDVIVAVNVLHVTRSIGETLAHVRSLLAPGGLLLIWELTRPALDFDVTYGLLMRPLQDGERSQGNPFLSGTQWVDALRANGFARVGVVPENDVLAQQVLLAQATTTSAAPGEPGLRKKSDVAEWFHIPSWKRTGPAQPAHTPAAERWLAFIDRCGLGRELVGGLERRGHRVATVEAGEELRGNPERGFTIDPRRPDDYAALIKAFRPTKVVHLWGVTPDGGSGPAPDAQFLDFRSLIYLAQAVGEVNLTQAVDLTIVSHHQQDVTGEETIFPERALTLAPCRVIPLEYVNLRCRSVDVVFPNDRQHPRLAEQLLEELESGSSDQLVAYRGPHRWVPIVQPLRIPPPGQAAPRLRKNGVYLITGGLGKIGLTVAEYLARTVAAKLVLTGRSARPRPDAKVRALEALGAEVLVATADVADVQEMQAAVTRAQERFGLINGVVHAAGLLGDGAIQQKTQEEIDRVLRPKVLGTLVLDTIFNDRSLDFFLLFSSLSAWKPGFGQVAYSAANNFLEAFVRSAAARRYRFAACISWDVWQGEGMAYDATAPAALQFLKEADFKERGILPQEGIDVFRRVLGSTHSHLLVSTSDYLTSDNRDLARLYLERATQAAVPVGQHVRPSLGSAYAPPAGETEERLVRIWQELLGVGRIGIDDSFFDLGGDSLIGTQLVTRVRAAFGARLPTRSVYLHPTIRSLSKAVEEALISQATPEKLDEALGRVEGLR